MLVDRDECRQSDDKFHLIRSSLVLEIFGVFPFLSFLIVTLLNEGKQEEFWLTSDSTKVCNRNIWGRTPHDRSWTQKNLPIFQKFLFFETTWHLKGEPLTRMLVELRWYLNTNFSRYSASKLSPSFFFPMEILRHLKTFDF